MTDHATRTAADLIHDALVEVGGDIWDEDIDLDTTSDQLAAALLAAGWTPPHPLGSDHHRVVVWADTYAEAHLIAGQMGSTVDVRELAGVPIKGPGSDEHSAMCTGAYLRV